MPSVHLEYTTSSTARMWKTRPVPVQMFQARSSTTAHPSKEPGLSMMLSARPTRFKLRTDDPTVTQVIASRDDHVQKNSIQSNSDELADSVVSQPVVLEDSEGKRFAACAVAQLLEAKHLQTSDMVRRATAVVASQNGARFQGGARATYMYVPRSEPRATCTTRPRHLTCGAFPRGRSPN